MFKKFFAVSFLIFVVLASVVLLWVSTNYQVPILMYHEVVPTSENVLNIVSPQSFRQQMSYLKQKRFRVISFEDLVDSLERKRDFSRRSVVITFDDGMENLYHHAFPVLKEFNLPAIIFMPSAMMGQAGYLSYEQMLEMQQSGLISFGSHTRDQVYLPELSEEEQDYQIYASQDDLQDALGVEIHFFAYPAGGFTEVTKELLKESGYRAAVTTNRGFDRQQKDLYELKRVSMRDHDRLWYKMKAKCSGYYNLFRKSVKPH